MKTTHYDISVDAADLLEDLSLDALDDTRHDDDARIDLHAARHDDDDARIEINDARHDDDDARNEINDARHDIDDARDDDDDARHDDDDARNEIDDARHDKDDADDDAVNNSRPRANRSPSEAALPDPSHRETRETRDTQLPDLSVLDEDDLPWVARLIDMVVACEGQPWRVALERIDGTQYLDEPIPPHHFAAVVGALQRVLGGRGHKAQLARACRELVLGHPALTSSTRADRVAAAARALSLSVADVERLLWSDLPRERPVELAFGRPSELEVVAFANVQLIQRAVRRAQTMSIAVRGDAGPLIRGAATRGLLATIGVAADDRGVTIIDIVGPLTLCHRTAVYGRAISSLVPFLAECSAFELILTATGVAGPYRSRLASPVLMPRLPATATTSSAVASRLARDLRRAMRDVDIVVGPPPVLVGDTFVCPDIAIDRGRLYIEIIGFWTASYLERKRAAYARAGLDVLFCVDAERGQVDAPRGQVDAARGHVDAPRGQVDAERGQVDAARGRGQLDAERGRGQLDAERGRRQGGAERGSAGESLPCNVIAFKRHVDVALLTGRFPIPRGYGRP